VNAWVRAQALASAAWAYLVLLWALICHLYKPLLMASSVGPIVGWGCYLAGPVVA
jgi:hypothetical protein